MLSSMTLNEDIISVFDVSTEKRKKKEIITPCKLKEISFLWCWIVDATADMVANPMIMKIDLYAPQFDSAA